MIRLNANENPFPICEALQKDVIVASQDLTLNRYPTPHSDALRESLAKHYAIKADNIVCGVGSDEIIKLLFEALTTAKDRVLSVNPSFVMYEFFAKIAKTRFIAVPLKNFQLDYVAIEQQLVKNDPKLVFICSPNNPTGALWSTDKICHFLAITTGIFVIDEAYVEFSSQQSLYLLAVNNPRIVVLRTFSKAYGLAGIRVGYAIGSLELISQLLATKPPYNISTLSEKIAVSALKYTLETKQRVDEILKERHHVYLAMQGILSIKVYASEANFIFFTSNKTDIAKKLEKQGILIRDFTKGCYRVSIGTEAENQQFLEKLKECVCD